VGLDNRLVANTQENLAVIVQQHTIESKIMVLGCVIGRRSITKIRLPPSGLAKNIILDSIPSLTPPRIKTPTEPEKKG
jgi:hypothetical protein